MKIKNAPLDLIIKYNLNYTNPVVYCFEHLPSGKKYIGSSNNLKRRMLEHFSNLNSNNHCNKYLLNYWNKYYDEFTVYVLEWLGSNNKDYLESREEFWIDFYQTYIKKYGFNTIRDPRIGGLCGYKHTEESKKKMSDSIKAFHMSPKSKQSKEQSRINLLKIDKEKTRENARTRGKLYIGESNPFFGKTHSEETKKILSFKKKGKMSGKNNPNYGNPISKEHKIKMREGTEKASRVVAVRHIVKCDDRLFYVINTQKFIEDIIDSKVKTRGMNYCQRWRNLKILFKSSQFVCSRFKYNNIPYYEIL
jgi:group I intron endonuclease